MNAETLSVQIRLMSQATDVALDLEANDPNAAEEKLFYISEDLGLLKVLVGADDASFKNMESINNSLKSRAVTAKSKKDKYI